MDHSSAAKPKNLGSRILFGIFLTAPMLYFGLFLPARQAPAVIFFEIILLTLLLFTSSSIFFKDAWHDLRKKILSRNILLTLALATLYTLVLKRFFLSESLNSLAFFIAVSILVLLAEKLLEEMHGPFQESKRFFHDLKKAKARVAVRSHQLELLVEKPLAEILTGEVIVVYPTERLLLDGIMISKEALVDESQVTGDALPVAKKHGDKLFAGSINLKGEIRVKSLGSDTVAQELSSFLKKPFFLRENSDEKSASHVSSFALIFSLLSLVVGIFIFGLGPDSSLILFGSLLILINSQSFFFAKSAPLGYGLVRLAKEGVLIKNLLSLAKAVNINTILFEKTGVLTRGEFKLDKIITFGLLHKNEILRLAAIAERESLHPIAKSIVSFALKNKINIASPKVFEEIDGLGVRASYQGADILVGSEHLIRKFNLSLKEHAEPFRSFESEGKTAALVAYESKVAGVIVLEDALRIDAPETVQALKRKNYSLVLISGEAEQAVRCLADTLGIKRFFANVRPEDKAVLVRKLKGDKRRVAAVIRQGKESGFAESGLVLALGGAASAKNIKADFLLLRDDLREIVKIFELSKLSSKKIRQNKIFVWAYSILALIFLIGLFGLTGPAAPLIAAIVSIFGVQIVFLNTAKIINYQPLLISLKPEHMF